MKDLIKQRGLEGIVKWEISKIGPFFLGIPNEVRLSVGLTN